MAVTSIWRVNGWLGKLVIYVENPEKTMNSICYEGSMQRDDLADVIDYATSRSKTSTQDSAEVLRQFVSGINCYPATARSEMLAVKRRFGKENGTVAYHGYQSFAPGEATPEMAHKIGLELAQQLWGKRYQVLVATHLDKSSHLHNHFVVNTVSFIDGIKYHRTAKDYHEMQCVSDTLCRKYGLSVIELPHKGTAKHYAEWRAEQEQRPTWRSIIRADVDEAIYRARTERQFFECLRSKGYELKQGKDLSLRPPGKERFVRLARNFGADYTIDAIRKRILQQDRGVLPLPVSAPKSCKRFTGTRKKATGFRALYLHYCYLLGVFPRKKPDRGKQNFYLLREDIAKLNQITLETRLLIQRRIDTDEQLLSYRQTAEQKIQSLTLRRTELKRKLRRVEYTAVPSSVAELREQISAISKELAVLRQEVKLCEDISVRSNVIRNQVCEAQHDQIKRRETEHHESCR